MEDEHEAKALEGDISKDLVQYLLAHRHEVLRRLLLRPGVELRANFKSISRRCHFFEVVLVQELTEETIHLPLDCLQGGCAFRALT